MSDVSVRVIGEVSQRDFLKISLLRYAVTDGMSVRECRVIVDFESGFIKVACPFSRHTRHIALQEYQDAEGDMADFVAAVLSDRHEMGGASVHTGG